MLPFVALTLGALALLLVADALEVAWGRWLAKPLASTGFVAAALAAGALSSGYGQIVLVALALCWLGDVLLIPRSQAAFFAGLVSFLLGHVAFVVAFVVRGVELPWLVLALVAVAPPAFVVLRWLRPHVPPRLRMPVRAYVAVISLMVACGAGAAAIAGGAAILLGALLFYVSDLAVARDRFVAPGFANKAWGLPLYYAATLVLASTVRSL